MLFAKGKKTRKIRRKKLENDETVRRDRLIVFCAEFWHNSGSKSKENFNDHL